MAAKRFKVFLDQKGKVLMGSWHEKPGHFACELSVEYSRNASEMFGYLLLENESPLA